MTAKKHPRKYDYVPDLPDMRDYLFSQRVTTGTNMNLPRKVDLRNTGNVSAIKNQGQLGSCTANSLSAAVEFEIRRKDSVNQKCPDLSRLFIYWNERSMEGTTRQDSGAQLRDGIKSLAALGVCEESQWGYDVSKFAIKPTVLAYAQAKQRKISQYLRLNSKKDIVNCLASGTPVVFGFSVYESFESDAVAKTGNVPVPESGERLLGGHAVYAVGYDLDAGNLLVANSWGAEWGVGGFFTMPFSYLEKQGLASDFWAIQG